MVTVLLSTIPDMHAQLQYCLAHWHMCDSLQIAATARRENAQFALGHERLALQSDSEKVHRVKYKKHVKFSIPRPSSFSISWLTFLWTCCAYGTISNTHICLRVMTLDQLGPYWQLFNVVGESELDVSLLETMVWCSNRLRNHILLPQSS